MAEAAPTTSAASRSSQEQIMGMMLGLVQGRSLTAAVELGIADALADGPLPLDQLAARTHADAGNLFRLLRALETLGIDRGIDLRRRQRGMAEQFLDRAEVAAASQEMGGEGMPQGVRRCRVRQSERAAQRRHRELHDAR